MERKIYRTLKTLPLSRFEEIQNTGNLNFLLKEDFDEILSMPENKEDAELKAIFDEFVFEFGELNLSVQKLDAEISIIKLSLLVEQETDRVKLRDKKNLLAVLESRLEKAVNDMDVTKSYDYTESLINISRWTGYHVDKHKITVKEYMTLLNQYNKENESK